MAIKLTTDERNDLTAIYAQLDAEWRTAGKPTSPKRMPFESEDIREWRKLTPDERIKGLRAYAWASDRITAAQCEAHPLTISTPPNTPRVLNKKTDRIPANAIYCGRPSPLGNPFVIGRDGNRKAVCDKYEAWLPTQPKLVAMISSLKGRDLVCFCAPERCHCNFLLHLANPELACR
jgi:hypothetical protein